MKKYQLNVIHTTFDYGMFKTIPFYRKAKATNGLVSSNKKTGGQFMHPALAFHSKAFTGKMELYLLDGNHRLHTCKFLKIGFRFEYKGIINDPEQILNLYIEINTVSKKLIDQEYLDAFCYFEKPEYVKLQGYMDKFLSSINTSTNLGEGITKRNTPSKFREGTYKFTHEDFFVNVMTEVDALRQVLVPPKPQMQIFNNRAILGFAQFYMCTKNYDRKRLIKALSDTVLPDYAESETFKGFFENKY